MQNCGPSCDVGPNIKQFRPKPDLHRDLDQWLQYGRSCRAGLMFECLETVSIYLLLQRFHSLKLTKSDIQSAVAYSSKERSVGAMMDKDAFRVKYASELATAISQLRAMSRKLQFLEPIQRPPSLRASRLGGPIAWPAGEPIPTDSSGMPMIFAAQINFEEVNGLPCFPKSGLLQLFLANDINERGITFLSEHRNDGDYPLRNGDGFKLVFHSDAKGLIDTKYQLPHADYPVYLPQIVSQPQTILFSESADQLPPMSHWRGSMIYQRFEQLPEAENSLVELYEILGAQVWDEQQSTGFYLGGYACPLQLDQRSFFAEYQKYDMCVMNFGELPLLDLPDMNLSILIAKADLLEMQFDDTVMIADTD